MSSSDDPSSEGYHVLRIDGFSRTFNKICGAPRFESAPFRAGGHTWKVGYYPRGTYVDNQDFISFYVFLVDDVVARPVNAEVKFSILDPELPKQPLHTGLVSAVTMATFSAPGSSYGYERFVRRQTLGALLELEDHRHDCFDLRVDVRVVKEETVLMPPSDMRHHLGHLLSRKEHTDVEFRVGEETFAAHRILLGARSPVFKAELFGPNKESKTTTTVIQIDMDPQVFKAMLTFIYTDTWPEMDSKQEAAMSQGLLVAAEQYGLQRLKLMCEHRLCNLIDGNTVEDILYLADKHQCAALKEACFDFVGSTATLLPAREALLAARETQELLFDRLVSLCPTITTDQIFNVLEHDWSRKCVEAVDITLDIE